jgi:alpha-L-fucosidase
MSLARKACAVVLLATCAASAQTPSEKRLQWWREARFGMFIHWGLYALPAGEWKGKPIPGIGEWIMNRAKIPVAEYEQLAKQFNPVRFNAEEWVAVAKSAGAKYIVITSKHHDGFAMYGSKVSKYNIVDATPFHRDPMKELAAACQKAGIRLCFYYSQTQDWHEPDGNGNTWDWPDESKKDFTRYLEEKVKPQVRELLTNYGPIGLIWFDTPRIITKAQSQELADLVHQLQPDCLVSGRIGHGIGDYDSAGDNQISVGTVKRDWETPVTMNDTWGFKKDDNNWKSTTVLIRQLCQIASRGGNYLLNVGPTAEGLIPQPSVERMAQIGQWLKVNGEAINGASPSPFPYELTGGLITTRPGKVYLHIFDWSRFAACCGPSQDIALGRLYGLQSKVRRAYLLANNSTLKISQKYYKATDLDQLQIQLPAAAPDANDSIVALDIQGEVRVDTSLRQQPNGVVTLPAHLGEIHNSQGGGLRIDSRGVVENWLRADEWMSWDFKVNDRGTYQVVLVTSEQKYGRGWEGGHRVSLDVAGQHLEGTVSNDGKEENPGDAYWPYVVSKIGSLKISKAGGYHLELKPQEIQALKKFGLTLVSVRLVPPAGMVTM